MKRPGRIERTRWLQLLRDSIALCDSTLKQSSPTSDFVWVPKGLLITLSVAASHVLEYYERKESGDQAQRFTLPR